MILISVGSSHFTVLDTEGEGTSPTTYSLDEWEGFWEGDFQEVKIALPAPLVFTFVKEYPLDRETLKQVIDCELEKIVVNRESAVHVELIPTSPKSTLLLVTELTSAGEKLLSHVRASKSMVTSRPLALAEALKGADSLPALALEVSEEELVAVFMNAKGYPLMVCDILQSRESTVNAFARKLSQLAGKEEGIDVYTSRDNNTLHKTVGVLSRYVAVDSIRTFDIEGVIKGLMEM